MRIISGQLGGRQILAPKERSVRPAMAKTREALFSMLESRGMEWQGALVLDLFSGSGSLAFECLSRGAASAVLVDSGRPACACARRNMTNLGLDGRARLVEMDVNRFLRQKPASAYNLVFLDPPYRRGLCAPALAALDDGAWLAAGAFIVVEDELPAPSGAPDSFLPLAERLFGQTRLRIWKKL